MEDQKPQQTVLLHGHERHIETVVDEAIDCRLLVWEQQKWHKQPGLVGPLGRITQYIGQEYDPQEQSLVSDAWEHDHCNICSWELHETEDPEHGIGYTDGSDWLCTECYTKLVAPGTTLPAV